MSEPYIGEIRMFGGDFAPDGWALCDGRLLAISQYTSLFSLIGTLYGGDGTTTFALPDLRGRAPVHPGNTLTLGDKSGGPGSERSNVTDGVSVARDLAVSTQSSGFAVTPGSIAPHPTQSVQFIISLHGIYPPKD